MRYPEATKTPRTQAAIKTYGDYIRSEDAVSIEFAEQLETELAEARAEIEHRKSENLNRASASLALMLRHAFMDGAFKGYEHGTEKKMRDQYFWEWANKNYPEAAKAAYDRDRLIKQMQEALQYALTEARSTECERLIEAALEAAERGGK